MKVSRIRQRFGNAAKLAKALLAKQIRVNYINTPTGKNSVESIGYAKRRRMGRKDGRVRSSENGH